jgi:transcriptional regulator with XRE-family HTH domain
VDRHQPQGRRERAAAAYRVVISGPRSPAASAVSSSEPSAGGAARERRPYPRLMHRSGPGSPLGEAIRRQRELNEVSMRQFAQMAGISNPYLSQIERGLREPSERVVDSIARSLEMSVDALYEAAGIDIPEDDEQPPARIAIEAASELTPRQRRALLDVYDAFVRVNRTA